jgi:hypothetical protein
LRYLATGRSNEDLKYSTSTKVWAHRSHLYHCQSYEILQHFSFLFYRFACANAACSSMHNYNSFDFQTACTIKMLAQNYHTDAQVCLYKKLIMQARQACSYVCSQPPLRANVRFQNVFCSERRFLCSWFPQLGTGGGRRCGGVVLRGIFPWPQYSRRQSQTTSRKAARKYE